MFNWSRGDVEVLPVATFAIIFLAVVFGLVLRNKSEKVRSLPLKGLAILIVLLEVCKQIYYNVYEPFTYYVLPLHFCSTFIWRMPLAQFTRGKVQRFFKPMPFCYSLIVIALIYAYPRVLLGNSTSNVFGSFHNTHTIMFHHVMVAYFAFSVAVKDYIPRKNDWIPLVSGVAFYALYAVPVAYILNVNYVNILKSDFPPFEKIRLSAGQVAYNALLFVVATGAILAIWGGYWLICFLVKKQKSKKKINIFIDNKSA